jgi:hypothetical protein
MGPLDYFKKAVVPYDGAHRNPAIGARNDDIRATPTSHPNNLASRT